MITPMSIPKLNKNWQDVFNDYTNTEKFKNLIENIKSQYLDKSKTIYPSYSDLFRAFNETAFDKIKVVILGQDPYHNEGQAHGLCFSVQDGAQAPPSLQNIFKEIESDIGTSRHESPDGIADLTRWAHQGVFLLNSVLTVIKNKPGSHSNIGWQDFTDYVIKTISDKRENVVFILWGAYARNKKDLINSDKHLILEAPHPSPLSAHRGFFGCWHFSKVNEYLKKHNKIPINW